MDNLKVAFERSILSMKDDSDFESFTQTLEENGFVILPKELPQEVKARASLAYANTANFGRAWDKIVGNAETRRQHNLNEGYDEDAPPK